VLAGGVLRLTRVSGPEAGRYTCTAKSLAGRAELVATLVIQEPPSVRLEPAGSVRVVAGAPLRLRCLVTGDPAPDLVWRRLGREGAREVARSSVLYEVAAVAREHEGTYACLASSAAGEAEERVQVLVLEAEEEGAGWDEAGPGEGRGPGQDFIVQEGGDARLEADVVGVVGGVRVVWRRQDGRPIPARHVQRDSVLYISAATRQDSGMYVCEGVDSRGTILFEFLANLVIAAAPHVRLMPEHQTVRPGDSPSITCEVVAGDEPVTVVWSRQDGRLPSAVQQRGRQLQVTTDHSRVLNHSLP
jgi:hemicentin